MLLSVFSHHSFLHLFLNMYVLQSFSSALVSLIGAGDFLSLFVGGGEFYKLCYFRISIRLFIINDPKQNVGTNG